MMTRVNSAIRGRKHVSYDCSDNTTDDAAVIVDHGGCEWCNGGGSGMSQDALPRESQRHGSGGLLSISRPPDLPSSSPSPLPAPFQHLPPFDAHCKTTHGIFTLLPPPANTKRLINTAEFTKHVLTAPTPHSYLHHTTYISRYEYLQFRSTGGYFIITCSFA